MAWLRAVAGRLKSDYQYFATLVYNNFAWCDCYNILDVQNNFPDATLADLYDPILTARRSQKNDLAVMAAYGFD